MTCPEAPTARSVPISRLPARMRAERALLIMLAQMAKKSSRMAPAAISRPKAIWRFSRAMATYEITSTPAVRAAIQPRFVSRYSSMAASGLSDRAMARVV